MCKYFVSRQLNEALPTALKFVKVDFNIPANSVPVERSFSAAKITKAYLPSSQNRNRLLKVGSISNEGQVLISMMQEERSDRGF